MAHGSYCLENTTWHDTCNLQYYIAKTHENRINVCRGACSFSRIHPAYINLYIDQHDEARNFTDFLSLFSKQNATYMYIYCIVKGAAGFMPSKVF